MEVMACQWNLAWEDKAANDARLTAMLTAAAPAPGTLVVLPELYATGFSMNVAQVTADEPARTLATLTTLARRFAVTLVGGVATRAADGRGLNQAVAVGPDGSLLTTYTKMHPFSFGGKAAEVLHYARGGEPTAFAWQGLVVAPFICYDLRFPEVFRTATRRGAQVLLVIANFPTARLDHWLALLTARAIENQAYVVGVNRCGEDPFLPYPGRSRIIDPQGVVLADGGDGDGVIRATLDPAAQASWRARFNALGDMHDGYVAP